VFRSYRERRDRGRGKDVNELEPRYLDPTRMVLVPPK